MSAKNIYLHQFKTIQLREMDEVKLMNRTDQKYWFHAEKLQGLLNSVNESYYVLEIDGLSILPYSTTYYDTIENHMFIAHHNGKLNRYKIRKRTYVSSGLSFLEIKFKNSKGRTIKKRIPTQDHGKFISGEEADLIKTFSPYDPMDLRLAVVNRFSRITLVNKNFKERCTIDVKLAYSIGNKAISLDGLVIIEIKTDGNAKASPLGWALFEARIRPAGFSKYCVGRTVTDSGLKRNFFKQKIRRIEKTIHTGLNLF